MPDNKVTPQSGLVREDGAKIGSQGEKDDYRDELLKSANGYVKSLNDVLRNDIYGQVGQEFWKNGDPAVRAQLAKFLREAGYSPKGGSERIDAGRFCKGQTLEQKCERLAKLLEMARGLRDKVREFNSGTSTDAKGAESPGSAPKIQEAEKEDGSGDASRQNPIGGQKTTTPGAVVTPPVEVTPPPSPGPVPVPLNTPNAAAAPTFPGIVAVVTPNLVPGALDLTKQSPNPATPPLKPITRVDAEKAVPGPSPVGPGAPAEVKGSGASATPEPPAEVKGPAAPATSAEVKDSAATATQTTSSPAPEEEKPFEPALDLETAKQRYEEIWEQASKLEGSLFFQTDRVNFRMFEKDWENFSNLEAKGIISRERNPVLYVAYMKWLNSVTEITQKYCREYKRQVVAGEKSGTPFEEDAAFWNTNFQTPFIAASKEFSGVFRPAAERAQLMEKARLELEGSLTLPFDMKGPAEHLVRNGLQMVLEDNKIPLDMKALPETIRYLSRRDNTLDESSLIFIDSTSHFRDKIGLAGIYAAWRKEIEKAVAKHDSSKDPKRDQIFAAEIAKASAPLSRQLDSMIGSVYASPLAVNEARFGKKTLDLGETLKKFDIPGECLGGSVEQDRRGRNVREPISVPALQFFSQHPYQFRALLTALRAREPNKDFETLGRAYVTWYDTLEAARKDHPRNDPEFIKIARGASQAFEKALMTAACVDLPKSKGFDIRQLFPIASLFL